MLMMVQWNDGFGFCIILYWLNRVFRRVMA